MELNSKTSLEYKLKQLDLEVPSAHPRANASRLSGKLNLEVSPMESIKVGLERALHLEVPQHQLTQELMPLKLQVKLQA